MSGLLSISGSSTLIDFKIYYNLKFYVKKELQDFINFVTLLKATAL